MLLLLSAVVVSTPEVVPAYAAKLSLNITPTSATVKAGSSLKFTITEQGADLVHLSAQSPNLVNYALALSRMTIDQFTPAQLLAETNIGGKTPTGTYIITVHASCLEPYKCRLAGETATANATLTVT